MQIGWDASAQGWLDHLGSDGDFGRRHVLDAPMMARVQACKAQSALDVGCSEGRFCRMMQRVGLKTTGLDPTQTLIKAARSQDSTGTYVLGQAESMPFEDATFDLVVSYLSLIDIDDMDAAIAEMTRVLRPAGRLLLANLQSFHTCWDFDTLEKRADGSVRATMQTYLQDRANEAAWGDIRVINHHRPLERYMQAFLSHGLHLTQFAEPPATGGDPTRQRRYNNAPWFLMMEWQKP